MLGRSLGGLAAAVLVAAIGWRRGSLSRGGATCAVPVGGLIVAGGGWWWGVLLVAFFATASVLSTVTRRARNARIDIAARGGERDIVQVLANGGVAAVLAGLALVTPGDLRPVCFAAFAGAVAAVTADTWATEVGTLRGAAPRLVTTGRIVPSGTSGGVTAAGTAASTAGALLIAGLAAGGAALGWAGDGLGEGWLLVGVTSAGIAGSLADSLLGASLQAAYRCPTCDRPTERRVHGCGTATVRVRGLDAVTNDVVNAAASLVGAAVAAGLALEGS